MKINEKTYDILKWIGITVIPALLAFYGVVGATLNIPNTEAVITIGVAFDTLWNTILGVESVKYHKGVE